MPNWGLEILFAAIALGIFIGVACIGGTNPANLIQGEDGRLSSSKFQFFVWTGTVIAAYGALVAAWAHNCTCPFSMANFPTLPNNVLLAMGFSVATLTAAKGVTSAYVASGRVAKNVGPARWNLADLIRADGSDQPDLAKVQMLSWTFIAVGTYIYSVIASLGTFGPKADFPDIPNALMVLMGIGQGAYLGAKVVGSTAVAVASISPSTAVANAPVQILGSGFGTQAGVVIFGATSIANPVAWTDSAITVSVPPGPTANTQVTVTVLLPGQVGPGDPKQSTTFTYG